MPTTSVGSHAQCAFHYDPRVPVLDNDPQGRKRKCGKCGEATQPGQRVANHVGDRCRRFKVLRSMKLVWCFGCLADFVTVAGPMALPPVSAMGVWWSRHWGNPHNLPWGKEYFGPMTEENIMTKVKHRDHG